MNLEPAPRLNKTTFILTAAGCLAVVILIGLFAPNKFSPLYFLTAVGFLIASITAIMIPILIDYAADSAEYVQQERDKVAEQVQRLHAASESLNRAAAHIKAVEEAVHKTAHAAEHLPYRMQEKLAEFNAQLVQTEDEEKERLNEELATLRAGESERLQAIADKIHRSATELATLEAGARKQLTTLHDAAARIDEKLKATLAKVAELSVTIVTAPPAAAAPVAAVDDGRDAPEPANDGGHRPPRQAQPPGQVEKIVESVSVVEAVAAPAASPEPVERAAVVEEPKPRKPRAPRKPRPEETLAAMSEPGSGDSGAEESPPAEAAGEPASAEDAPKPEASVSSDGATRLLATAYIGIGNKLYIRGDGPGLSWDKGVPMQFVSIGKWGWATDEATAPIACKLYKNDETAALSGEVFLEPGKHVEVTALF